MTEHDPLCPYFPERQGFGGIDSGVPSTQPYIAGVPCQCDLIARVREDEATRAHRMSDAYRTALRDAVEAVKALGELATYGIIHRDGGYCDGDEIVAAIEALGGER